jgi:hypothetical protein
MSVASARNERHPPASTSAGGLTGVGEDARLVRWSYIRLMPKANVQTLRSVPGVSLADVLRLVDVGPDALVVLAAVLPAAGAGAPEPCCFANDRFEGVCTVVPGEGETCQRTLPLSTGKSWCGSTSVRGGWVKVGCKTGKPVGQQDSAGSSAKTRTDGEAPGVADAR